MNLRTPSTHARCLLNPPNSIYLSDYQFTNILPGKLYSLDDQCMLINGAGSNYFDCSVKEVSVKKQFRN